MKIHTKISVLVEKNDKILLIKEWSNKKNGYYWNIIKGTYGDVENETLAECAKREAKEEAGIEIIIDKLISCYVYAEELFGLQFNFLAHPKDGSIAEKVAKEDQEQRDEDIVELKWVKRREIKELVPEEFMSKRTYQVIQDWLKSKKYSLETLTGWD